VSDLRVSCDRRAGVTYTGARGIDLPYNPIGHCNACDHVALITRG
jgi:hypothetical protein